MATASPATPITLIYRCADYLAGALRLIAALCVAAMATVTMSEIVLRYFFLIPLPWANEAARTLFLWSVMFGIAVATWLKAHIAVTLLEGANWIPVKRAVRVIAIVCILGLSLLLAIEGASFANTNLANITPALEISLAAATSSVAAGGIFMSVFAFLTLLEELFPAFREAGLAARSRSVTP